MLKLVVFVPTADKETVKTALFEAGAGRIGDYEWCAWECPGVGQFRPMSGAQPAIGQVGALEHVEEYRIETVLEDAYLEPVIDALRRAHPYEEPAFDVIRLLDVPRRS